jgi:hypothetical protein
MANKHNQLLDYLVALFADLRESWFHVACGQHVVRFLHYGGETEETPISPPSEA